MDPRCTLPIVGGDVGGDDETDEDAFMALAGMGLALTHLLVSFRERRPGWTLAEPRPVGRAVGMSASGSTNPRPMSSSAETGEKVLRGQGDEERWDDEDDAAAAELDPQLERAESEGMVTERAKLSSTDPGPEPTEPEPTEPEPDHGPGDPEWDAEERD